MSLVIPPGFAEASIEIRNDGDPDSWFVTFGVDLSEVGGDFDAAASKIGAAWADHICADMTAQSTVVGTHLVIGVDGGDPLRIFHPNGSPGTSTGAHLPQNCALLVTKVTPLGGRRGKGRIFVPGVLVDAAVNQVGVIDATTRAALQDDFDAFGAFMASGGPPGPIPAVLLHRTGISEVPGPTIITGFQVQPVISTQRRRLR